jgi:hypothetical protein
MRRLVCGVFMHLLSATAAAQPAGTGAAQAGQAAALQQAVDEMRARLDEQRQLIAEQARQIDAQTRVIDTLRQRLDDFVATGLGAAPSSTPPAPQPPAVTSEQTVKRQPDLPEEIVTAGDFPGSIAIPGTNAALKLGGELRASLVHTLGPLGTDDRFIASSIPVGPESAGDAARTTYTAAPTRANFDLRSPLPFGVMRAFVEGDFDGDGNTMRLRHSYIQLNRWMFGQTWSTFSDPEVEPIDIDFEGENALSRFRQAQVRYTMPLRSQLDVAVAVENPAPDLTGAEGVNLTPDFVARVRWKPQQGLKGLVTQTAHVQAAILARTLRGELADQSAVSTGGFGVTISGVLIPRWHSEDRIKFAAYSGWGLGRYITDLNAAGGQDAVYDATNGTLRALPASSAYVAYERRWRPKFLSSLAYGLVTVHNLDVQVNESLHRTQRTTANIAWTPVPRADFLLEFLAGERVNKDGERGTSTQVQAGWKVRF